MVCFYRDSRMQSSKQFTISSALEFSAITNSQHFLLHFCSDFTVARIRGIECKFFWSILILVYERKRGVLIDYYLNGTRTPSDSTLGLLLLTIASSWACEFQSWSIQCSLVVASRSSPGIECSRMRPSGRIWDGFGKVHPFQHVCYECHRTICGEGARWRMSGNMGWTQA